jgi:hypothetical protein
MEYIWVTVQFFQEHWDEVGQAAALLVSAWLIIGALAPQLAERLRQVRDKAVHSLPWFGK